MQVLSREKMLDIGLCIIIFAIMRKQLKYLKLTGHFLFQ